MNESTLSTNLIIREELEERLNRGDQFKLVNALGEWAFEAKRILGSINTSNTVDARTMLDPYYDIVIHSSNPSYVASIIGYQILTRMGYRKVRRYAGGISDWEDSGYQLEGSFVD